VAVGVRALVPIVGVNVAALARGTGRRVGLSRLLAGLADARLAVPPGVAAPAPGAGRGGGV